MPHHKYPHLVHPRYRPDIDGLRAVAILAVVLFHAFPGKMPGGYIGVDIFFVISGFLISTIIFSSLERDRFSLVEFYARRVRRIFPALILVLTTSLVVGWFILFSDEYKQLGKHTAAGTAFIQNFVLWRESGYFDNAAETKPLLHLWSLAVEEQFYIIWPALLVFVWKRRWSFLRVTVGLGVISFAANIYLMQVSPIAAFYLPIPRFWELMIGGVLAYIALHKPQFAGKYRNSQSALGFLLIGVGLLFLNKESEFPGWWALLPTLGAMFIISAGPNAWLNQKLLANKLMVGLGLISYPLYLWHWPILSFGQIFYDGPPPSKFKNIAILITFLLSWLTVKFFERPFRFGNQRNGFKVKILCGMAFAIGIAGLFSYVADYSQSHSHSKSSSNRVAVHKIGSSSAWYEGKSDWLFLGNSYDRTVAKLKLANVPSENEIKDTKEKFLKLAKTGAQYNTKVVLIVGPNKSSVYPEYLPDELVPSAKKYISFFLDELAGIPNLVLFNPTDDLIGKKKTEGYLYYMTDTHWNSKGAFLAYSGFLKLLNLPVPKVYFQHNGSTHKGDLINISKLTGFPLHAEDNWSVVWETNPVLTEILQDDPITAFGPASIVTNHKPLSDKCIWVVGDSFSGALRQYFNATFKEVRYVGHWNNKLNNLSSDLEKASIKPDMIIIVRVERSF